MTHWTRRLIGPGPTRDAGPTQPLDDTPEAAHGCWLPSDALADAVTQAQLPSEAGHWDHVIAYVVIGAVCFALGALVVS